MAPTEFKWAILATGMISKSFVNDILIDPATRDVHDIKHVVYAVASRSKDKAQEFINANVSSKQTLTPIAYGSYDEMFKDPQIDAVYIGTPHNLHYHNVYQALINNKHVLCEKPFTANSKQAQILIDLARQRHLFLMEAVWTRFQPFSDKLQQLIHDEKAIGTVKAATAELASDFDHVLGPYPWTLLVLAVLPRSKASNEPLSLPRITSTMTKTNSGVDATTCAMIEFESVDHKSITTTMTASQVYHSPSGSRILIVHGSKGYIEVTTPTYRPESVRLVAWESEQAYNQFIKPKPIRDEIFNFTKRPGNIWGMAWEADQVAKCVMNGKLESDKMPLRDTILMSQVFDVIRQQGGLKYPDHIESVEL
ncbi:hypothetical protein OIO90_001476 [Microbotryomycetes sp. JL221]|nr:hypothetical protein OIO90_001476 [Microbotryomycetes sp. JL221]